MKKEEIEIKNESKEKECCCSGECKKRKIWPFLIIFIILMILAFVGGMFAGKEYFIDEISLKEDKEVLEKVDENEYSTEDDNYVIDDFDEYLLNNYHGSDVENVIFSSNGNMHMSSSIVGAMYSENISDEFKILFSLNEVLSDEFVSKSLDNNTKYDDDMNMHFYLKKETLEKIAKNDFKDVSVDDNFKTSNYLGNVISIECKDGQCEIVASTEGGYTGYFSHYNSKLIKVDYNDKKGLYQYTVSTYYIDYVDSDDSTFRVMDQKDGKVYKSFSDDVENDYLFDRYSSYVDRVPTYNFFFDKDNRLVFVEKVS